MADPNLTSGQVLPGFYSSISFNAAGSGVAPGLRCLLFGTVKSTALRPLNQPFLAVSQQDADDGCGRGSELAAWYASCVSQPETLGAEVWLVPIAEPSGGTASTYKLKVILSATNPAKAGTLTFWLKSQKVAEIGFDTSDTKSTIATALCNALNANCLDLPIGTCTVATDVVTIPYLHKGTTGEDLPMQCDVSPVGTGVNLSPGQALFATSATGAGTVRITTGALSVSASLAGGESASQVATAVVNAWNADSYPLSAAVDATTSSQANLFFRNGQTVRRLSAAVVTSTGTTVDLGSGATDGTGSATSLSYNGTQGVGAPTLTGALANLDKLSHFRSWAAPWLDTTTVGAIATKMEALADGSITGQKPSTLTIGEFHASSVAGAIATGTSPNLTTSAPRYAILRCEDAPVQGMDLAARVAGARASKWIDDPQFNWNAFQVKGSSRAPIMLPASKPTSTVQNTDLKTYALAPLVAGASGNLEIVKGRTTSLSTDRRMWAWSVEAQAAFHAVDLPAFLQSRFQGTSTVQHSEPKAAGIIDAASVTKAVQERMRYWEGLGSYDGADALADFVQVTPNPNNPFRFDIKLPESPVLDLDQMVSELQFASPSA